jgi:hypothetical protein
VRPAQSEVDAAPASTARISNALGERVILAYVNAVTNRHQEHLRSHGELVPAGGAEGDPINPTTGAVLGCAAMAGLAEYLDPRLIVEPA